MRNPEGMRPLGRPRRRCVDYITVDLRGTGCGGMEWVDLAQDRGHLRTSVSIKYSCKIYSISMTHMHGVIWSYGKRYVSATNWTLKLRSDFFTKVTGRRQREACSITSCIVTPDFILSVIVASVLHEPTHVSCIAFKQAERTSKTADRC